ncbi:MAG: hypothetical protein QM796_07590 [Chthoniobacteraceae bacterium]
MKSFLSLILFLCTVTLPVFADELSSQDSKALLKEATQVKTAYEKGDADTIIKLTHPSIYPLAGGKDAFDNLTRNAMKQLKATGITMSDFMLGTPSQTYLSGTTTVCFVPLYSIISAQGRSVRNTSFLIAAREPGQKQWLFLDGAGLRAHPEALKTFFPGLPDDVKLPKNQLDPIQ